MSWEARVNHVWHHQVRSCARKFRFEELAEAQREVLRMFNARGARVTAYYCVPCDGYHIAGARNKKMYRAIDKLLAAGIRVNILGEGP
tara:strand:+ start:373 stop:636 length:264 start_codon:yes stop_codon:yes gene_type:complete